MKIAVLIGYTPQNVEQQVLVLEDEFADANHQAQDFFTSNIKNPHVAGYIECTGDIDILNGVYRREE